MPVPTTFADLSTTVASNSPAGSENVFPDLDNYIRFINAALASIKANTATNGWVSPYIAGTGSWAIPGTIGSTTPNTGAFTTLTATDGSGVAALDASKLTSGTVAAARLSTATTAAQFDNDTSIATTAFVQQALGNLAGTATYNTSTNLLVADFGKWIIVPSGTGSISLALPTAAVTSGSQYRIYNETAASNVTLTTTGQIVSGASGALGSIVIGPGQTFDVTTNGVNNWVISQGDPKRQAMFASSLTSNGYQYLPSGLIIQWGTSGSIAGSGGTLSVTFPVAFPTACLWVSVQPVSNGTAANFAQGSGTATTTTLTAQNQNNIATTMRWSAIGY